MTDLTEALTKQLLSQLPHYSKGWNWDSVFRAAKMCGESDDYARFLAGEHCRINDVPLPRPLLVEAS